MRTLVESLKRLYNAKRITEEQLSRMAEDNKITDKEVQYIIGGILNEH